jgi:hypothetical protein
MEDEVIVGTTSDHIIATMTFNTIVAIDTIVAFFISLQ